VLAAALNVARGSVTAVRSPYRRVAIGRSWRLATGVRSRRVVTTNASPGGCTPIHQSASLDMVCDLETSCAALKAL
jgi:hypothetical protein